MKASKVAGVVFATLFATLFFPRTAASQTYLDLSPQTSPVVNTPAAFPTIPAMGYYTRRHGASAHQSLEDALTTSSLRSSLPDPDPAALQQLDFTPSRTTTQEVNEKIIAALAPHVPVEKRPQLRQLVDSGELPLAFAKLLSKFGYSPDNLADVMTAYIILSWETIHNGDATQYPRGIEAVHQRVRHAMAMNPNTGKFSNAEKQGFAQDLTYMVMLNVVDRKRLRKNGDTAKLRQLEQSVSDQTKGYGLDLDVLQLTDKGFVIAR